MKGKIGRKYQISRLNSIILTEQVVKEEAALAETNFISFSTLDKQKDLSSNSFKSYSVSAKLII